MYVPARFNRAVVLLLVTTPFFATGYAIWLLWERAVSWRDIAVLAAMYAPVSLGVTVGYHRMLTHRSFRAHPSVRLLLLVFGCMAMEGPPVDWAANHLKHHALSDKQGDPHSPLEGLFHAHLGWLFSGKQADPNLYCRDLLKDRLVMFADRAWLLWAAVGLLIPLALGGWTGFLWGGLVRSFLVHHSTWSVNSICHAFGQRSFSTPDRSRNQWVVGLLAFGEGWHNNHHAFPNSAVHGLDRWQFDLSAWFIAALEKLGLVSEVYRPSPVAIARRRLRGGSQ